MMGKQLGGRIQFSEAWRGDLPPTVQPLFSWIQLWWERQLKERLRWDGPHTCHATETSLAASKSASLWYESSFLPCFIISKLCKFINIKHVLISLPLSRVDGNAWYRIQILFQVKFIKSLAMNILWAEKQRLQIPNACDKSQSDVSVFGVSQQAVIFNFKNWSPVVAQSPLPSFGNACLPPPVLHVVPEWQRHTPHICSFPWSELQIEIPLQCFQTQLKQGDCQKSSLNSPLSKQEADPWPPDVTIHQWKFHYPCFSCTKWKLIV